MIIQIPHYNQLTINDFSQQQRLHSDDIHKDGHGNTGFPVLVKPLHLRANLANGKRADICVACVHIDVGKDVFLFDSRSFGFAQVWGDICL